MIRAAFQTYRAAYSGLPREVWLLAVVLFVNRCGTMVMPFLTLYLTSQLGMSAGAAGRMISVYGVGSICGAYLSGRYCERLGAVRLQTVCMFLSAPGFLLLAVWSHWLPLAISLFALSLVCEAVRPANATAITKLTTQENRTRAFAVQRLAANLGFSFGPAMGGVLATYSFLLLFVVDALTTLLAAAALLAFFRMRRIESNGRKHDPAVVRVTPLKDSVFVVFLALSLASMMVFLQFGSTYPLYLRDHFGMSKPQIGLMFAVNTSIIVVFEMLLINRVRHWHLIRTIGWGSFLSCVGFGILPLGSSGAFAVLAMAVVTVGEMLSFSLSSAFVANRSTAGSEGLYMGWYTMVMSAAWTLGPAIGGAIYAVEPAALWYTALAVGVGVLAGFHVLAGWSPLEIGVPVEDAPA